MVTQKTDGLPFTVEEAQAAYDEWGFNCGPGALCALTQLKPEEIRPHLGDFEKKGYTNPALMKRILDCLGVDYDWECCRGQEPYSHWPIYGLVRVQWDGAWPEKEEPRHTHWIGFRRLFPGIIAGSEVFDVNTVCAGGWWEFDDWRDQVVPWLLQKCEPEASGDWWPTHIVKFKEL